MDDFSWMDERYARWLIEQGSYWVIAFTWLSEEDQRESQKEWLASQSGMHPG